MKNKIIIMTFILLLSGCANTTTDSQEMTSEQIIAQEVLNNENIGSEDPVTPTGNKIYTFQYPHKCEVLGSVTYNYPEMEMDLTVNSSETSGITSTINILNRDGLSYTWNVMDMTSLNQGSIVVFATYEEDPGVYSDEEMQEIFSEGFNEYVSNLQEKFKDSCERWDLDESIFELPEDIDFTLSDS